MFIKKLFVPVRKLKTTNVKYICDIFTQCDTLGILKEYGTHTAMGA